MGKETPFDARGTGVEVPTLGLSRWTVPPPPQVLSGCPLTACPARSGAPSMSSGRRPGLMFSSFWHPMPPMVQAPRPCPPESLFLKCQGTPGQASISPCWDLFDHGLFGDSQQSWCHWSEAAIYSPPIPKAFRSPPCARPLHGLTHLSKLVSDSRRSAWSQGLRLKLSLHSIEKRLSTFFFFLAIHAGWHAGSSFPDQGSNPYPTSSGSMDF